MDFSLKDMMEIEQFMGKKLQFSLTENSRGMVGTDEQ